MTGFPGKARLATVVVLALVLVATVRHTRTSAADSESITWGAVDPSWSPDGKRLAFSLFGSIWQVSAEGGEAAQVTDSPGYHGHPAWSPKGSQIAFVAGSVPVGRVLNISGKLRIVDVDTGQEREISLPLVTAGRPAWSPEGDRIVCGLIAPNTGSLLHEIRLADDVVTPIQSRMQRGPAGFWTDASWSARNNEIFFAAQRTSAAQIWSMPAGRPPIMVQLPLTGYRAGDIALLDSLAALPDGSGVVYSAAIVNGRGNYELYRVGRQGGAPVAITHTERDEFTPAVSPDGRWIAHASNHPGNIDLYLTPVAGGDSKHLPIAGLKFRRPYGRVRVRTLDETGQPVPVRLHNIAADQKSYAPPGSPVFYQPLELNQPRVGFFIGRGEDEFPVPAGTLRLTALKGIEYRIAERTVEVRADQTSEISIPIERWTNWSRRGWWTGENHFHANYNGAYYQRPRDSLAWLEAEDLNTANMIVANSEGAFIHDMEFFRGSVDPLSKPRYVLYWGQEYRNSDPLGHMAFLNIKKQVPPSFTSVIGSGSPYDFPLNTMAALEARSQGGLVSYVHPMMLGGADVFDTNLGAKEAPLTAALGAMDAIDVLPRGGPAFEMWYRFLNSGFHILPGAGTDVFTNWRGVNGVPGGARQYVEVGGPMDWDLWIARYRQGRVFVTNGPLVEFRLNGLPAGSVIAAAHGQPYAARLSVAIESRVPISAIEFLLNGTVIDTRRYDPGVTTAHAEKEVALESSSWVAVRVSGPPARGVAYGNPIAHSGAAYVEFDGRPTLIREDLELMVRWLNRLWFYLEERNNFGPGDNRLRARQMFDQAFEHYRWKIEQARGR